MPTDCTLEDNQSDRLLHPLPGENTRIFLFNQYVLLTKKFSAALDQLYTTTRRRGGVEKITRLERDLRVWNHTFNAMPHAMPFEIGETPPRASEDDKNKGQSFMNHWLQLLANIVMVQIHRPALTFDMESPEFAQSLKVCLKSSTAVINLLQDNPFGWSLRRICPSGPAVVFQSALMHVYSQCSPAIPAAAGSPGRTAHMSTISTAVQLMNGYVSHPMSHQPGSTDFRHRSIAETK